MNLHSLRAIYSFELSRSRYWPVSAVVAPVMSTTLYFIVFGAAIGSHLATIDGVSYGAFIIPGLVMLTIVQDTIVYAAYGIFAQKVSGALYEVLSAPISAIEIVPGYVGAATAKSAILGILTLLTARLFVTFTVVHPVYMIGFWLLISLTFSLIGFVLGLFANEWSQIQSLPMLIVTPLIFLGGAFYSSNTLADPWRTIALYNPLLYLVSAFRWTFYDTSDVNVAVGIFMTAALLLLCLSTAAWIFRTGYKLKP